MDEPSRLRNRAEAANEVASAALSLARAREHLADEPDAGTRTLIEYVAGWTNRALIEIVEPQGVANLIDPDGDVSIARREH